MTMTTVITMSHAKTIALAMLLTMAVATTRGTTMATSTAMTTTFQTQSLADVADVGADQCDDDLFEIVQGVRQWRVRSPT